MEDLTANDAGVDLQRLQGPVNYTRWSRDIRLVADVKGVWDLISGAETILSKPDRDDYFQSSRLANAEIKRLTEMSEEEVNNLSTAEKTKRTKAINNASSSSKPDKELIQMNIMEFKLDLEEYEKQHKLIRLATALLTYWVDPAIRGKLQKLDGPHDIWMWIASQYKLDDTRAMDMALNEMEKVTLASSKNVQTYLNKLEMLRQDIEDVGGTVTDGQMLSKIIRGLTPQYNSFVEQYHLLQNLAGIPRIDLAGMTTKLLAHESILDERRKNKAIAAVNDDKKKDKDKKKDGKKINDGSKWEHGNGKKCTYEKCGRWGHTEEECFRAHPELFKGKQDGKTDNNKKEEKVEEKTTTTEKKRVVAMTRINLPAFKKQLEQARGTIYDQLHIDKHIDDDHIDYNDEVKASGTHILPSSPAYETKADILDQVNLPELDDEGCGGHGEDAKCRTIASSISIKQHSNLIFGMLVESDENNKKARDTWILDSGANAHVVNDIRWFNEFHPCAYFVDTADQDSRLAIKGGGSVSIDMQTKEGVVELQLTNVAYAPETRCNILSLSLLAEDAGLCGDWGNQSIEIYTSDKEMHVATALLINGLYELQLDGLPAKFMKVVSTLDFSDPVWVWHRRLGHLSIDGMRRLLKISDGMDISDKDLKSKLGEICPVCATTKAITVIPREPAARRYTKLGDLLHVDSWGIYSIPDWQGNKYALKMTDDATRFSYIEFFKNKDEIPTILRDMHKRLEKENNVVIRRYRFDNELIISHAARDWFKKHGITIEPTAPYTHHQVGVAERLNRTDREITASILQENTLGKQLSKIIRENGEEMLRQTKLPSSLWSSAMSHAIYLKNRSPTRALKSKKTPYEARTGFKPNLSRERIWGSRTYVTIPLEKQKHNPNKLLKPRAWLGYFVGCESESIYMIWDPEKKKVLRVSAARVQDGAGLDDDHGDQGEPLPARDEAPEPGTDAGPAEASGSESGISDANDDDEDVEVEAAPEVIDLDDDEDDDALVINMAKRRRAESDDDDDDEYKEEEFDEEDYDDENIKSDPGSASESDEQSDIGEAPVIRRPRGGFKKGMKQTPLGVAPKPARHYRQPLIEKCLPCIKNMSHCDGKTPCGSCTRGPTHYNCVQPEPGTDLDSIRRRERTKEQKLVEQIDGRKVRKGAQPIEDKCRNCWLQGRYCDQAKPICGACAKHFITTTGCVPRLTPVDPKPPIVKDKCARCRQKTLRCSEVKPCEACVEAGVTCGERNIEQKKKTVKCTFCTGQRVVCDGNKPCDTCFKYGKDPCSYIEGPKNEIGEVTASYYTNPKRHETMKNDKATSFLTQKEADDFGPGANRCTQCETWDIDCDGGLPCNFCAGYDEYQHPAVTCTYKYPHCKLKMKTSEKSNTLKLPPPSTIGIHRRNLMRDLFEDKPDVAAHQLKARLLLPPTNLSHQNVDEDTEEEERQEESMPYIKKEVVEEDPEPERIERIIPAEMEDDIYDASDREYEDDDFSDMESVKSEEFEDNRALDEDLASDSGKQDDASSPDSGENARVFSVVYLADLSTVSEPKTKLEAFRSSESKAWREAMEDEYHSLIKNDTWDVVDCPPNKKPVSTKWVFTRKLGPEGQVLRHKARFVARGFEQIQGIDFNETYASVVKAPSYKVFFALQSLMGWKCHQMDVKTAFLQGDIDEQVYITTPDGFPESEGKVLRLKKALYGLKQSPRIWKQHLDEFLVSKGFKISDYDPCVYLRDATYVTVYVDDINIFSSDIDKILMVKQLLSARFDMTDLGECSFYLGAHVMHETYTGNVYLHQASFVQKILDRFNLHDIHPVSTPIDIHEKLSKEKGQTADNKTIKLYQQMVGSLMYLTTVARFDIAQAVSMVSRYIQNPNAQHFKAVKRIYAYLKGTPTLGCCWSPQPDNQSKIKLEAYVDSDWGGCQDTGRSTTGWVFRLAGCPVSWSSKRQKTVAVSTAEAEYMAAAEAAKEAIWMKGLLTELDIPRIDVDTVTIYCDNQSAIKLAKNPEFHSRTKHIKLRHHFIRELVESGEIALEYINTKLNIADIMTKGIARPEFQRLIEESGMIKCPCPSPMSLESGEC